MFHQYVSVCCFNTDGNKTSADSYNTKGSHSMSIPHHASSCDVKPMGNCCYPSFHVKQTILQREFAEIRAPHRMRKYWLQWLGMLSVHGSWSLSEAKTKASSLFTRIPTLMLGASWPPTGQHVNQYSYPLVFLGFLLLGFCWS